LGSPPNALWHGPAQAPTRQKHRSFSGVLRSLFRKPLIIKEHLAMRESQSSQAFMFDNSDPEMQRAYEAAGLTFRYFWREVVWERRWIIPGLDLACVKASFSDGQKKRADGAPSTEHMWLSEIDFDGEFVSGVLVNSPNWVKSFKKGDSVRVPLNKIKDGMYAISGVAFGGYTVNLMRSRMACRELKEHDAAWGLNFGDPTKVRVTPHPGMGDGLLKSWFSGQPADTLEHPMSVNMAASLKEQLAKTRALISSTNDRGWTLLHHEALAGSAPTVKVLLEAGADPTWRTNDGKTPSQLAQSLGWDNVVALL
jgi:uncharacterized protein YegJ (DUF2314 family)